MAGSIINIFRIRELRKRVFFTLFMLVVYRLGSVIPIPGIDVNALKDVIASSAQNSGGIDLMSYLNFFVGGAFERFSIFLLGIMPYISMSIIMQLLLLVFPKLKKISEEEGGRKKIQRYSRYGTVLVCIIQALTIINYAGNDQFQEQVLKIPMAGFVAISILATTCGTLLLMWMGEQITQKGIGNGISLIIFAGIAARLPSAIKSLIDQVQAGDLNVVVLLLVMMLYVIIIALVIYEQQGQRKIPVNYARRIVGRKVYGGQSQHIPFKINPSGVIPVIFASSILTFPLSFMAGSQAEWVIKLADFFRYDGAPYQILYCLLIIFFAYFYTQVTLNPQEISKNIRENGGSIPGIRSDKIEEYLTRVLNRIILPGSLFLAFIAVIPTVISAVFGFPAEAAMLMGGTSLLIMVGVDLDTMSQIEGHLKMHHQEGLVKKGKIRSRNL